MKHGTIPVRISARRYRQLSKIAKSQGFTLTWLLNLAVDLYMQSLTEKDKAELAAGAAAVQAAGTEEKP